MTYGYLKGSAGGALTSLRRQSGKLGWILLWAIGVPIPILLILFLLRGCT